jgi:hypothetical protein
MSIQSVGGESARVQPPTINPQPTKPAPQTDGVKSPFQRVLEGLGKEINTGEHTMHRALAAGRTGADVAPGDLLALQAGVYRYSETIDLASKLIDRTATGVKTIINGGGQ